ncbi:MAG TPA: sugar phosphate nucleotidyltransferase [Vicinamibacterales bacterium]|jgi:mannose-1-phosphate guanylyltransferase|nr:sugar phosphate nucleotidyltransferase [Vicinamibacterales bacterium]
MRQSRPWAAVLAGGNGTRLQSLTRSLAGDARPKQFCRFFGGHTLLADTRSRVALNVEPGRTLYVVSRAHEPFYSTELADVERRQLIEQPVNRGTTAAVAAALFRLHDEPDDTPLGFFPADHYYRDAQVLQETVTRAYALAALHPDRVVLVGAEASRAETEYGWIEPSPALIHPRAGVPVHQVKGFWEKPSGQIAADLLARRCLWNTLVVIGQLQAFKSLLRATVPDVWDDFETRAAGETLGEHQAALRDAYAAIRPSDFSHEVLSASPERLLVVTLPEAGWTDLGQPHRVLDVLAERREVLGGTQCAAG